VYGPHIGPPPAKVQKPFFSGKMAAGIVFVVFVGLVIGAIYLLQWLSGAH
jgi:hypothetical protein